uniref:LOV domain-containing protein n=1 Tax=Phaeomonas parva TaxID=124430 RepID=A0A7S1UBS4_9STRA|mmetsp:Transcript_40841/g.127928  ORF Transcript_40841/g.127928 Transcript_40841/m.127928 type:complete len:473 (+) Transcript_40841:401-1819(+)
MSRGSQVKVSRQRARRGGALAGSPDPGTLCGLRTCGPGVEGALLLPSHDTPEQEERTAAASSAQQKKRQRPHPQATDPRRTQAGTSTRAAREECSSARKRQKSQALARHIGIASPAATRRTSGSGIMAGNQGLFGDLDLLPVLDSCWSERELMEIELLTRDGEEPKGEEEKASKSTEKTTSNGDQKKRTRAERNREHARRSRARKKNMVESVERTIKVLQDENKRLRTAISSQLGTVGEAELRKIDLLTKQKVDDGEYTTGEEEGAGSTSESEGAPKPPRDSSEKLCTKTMTDANQLLIEEDYSLLVALKKGKQNFLVTDPRLPDNPIVFASAGFMTLTGYAHEEVLGRNCRFLQGPDTDPVDVERIRNSINTGEEISVCLLNYKKDGSTFWNQFFITPLRDPVGNTVNFVGVQQLVTPQVAQLLREQARGNLSAFEEERKLIEQGERLRTETIRAEQLDAVLTGKTGYLLP